MALWGSKVVYVLNLENNRALKEPLIRKLRHCSEGMVVVGG